MYLSVSQLVNSVRFVHCLNICTSMNVSIEIDKSASQHASIIASSFVIECLTFALFVVVQQLVRQFSNGQLLLPVCHFSR